MQEVSLSATQSSLIGLNVIGYLHVYMLLAAVLRY